MKKQLLVLLAISLFLSACGNSTGNSEKNTETEKNSYNTEINTEQKQTEKKEETTDTNISDYDVEIIFSAIISEEDFNIETYVSELNNDNDQNYYVYDDEHYAQKIKESERLEMLEKLNDEKALNEEIIVQLNENYPEVFKEVKFVNDGKDVLIYVDGEKYNNSDFGAPLSAIFSSSIISETIQAYNLVPLEERVSSFKIIDFETEEVVYEE